MLKWGSFESFYALGLIVALIILFFVFEKIFSVRLGKKFGSRIAPYLTQSVSYFKRRMQLAVQCLGLLFVIVALARPQLGASQQEVRSEGIELLILADVSESMMAEDVRPSRLAQMKIELSQLLDIMPGNKIGVIAFAGSSSLLCPLTTDPNALKMYIDSLDINSVSTQGTNFETALMYAKEAFEKGGVTQDQTTKTTRVVLIASDGEDQEKGALEAAKKLADSNIRIFTMAYGTEKGAAIITRDQSGNMTGFKKDSSGQTVMTQVKGDFLRQLAEAGKGQFYFAYLGGDHLKKFVKQLGELEKAQFQSSMAMQYDEKFTIPLLIGFILLLASCFITDRKKRSGKDADNWKGRYEVSS
ncbi:MAG: VWA domain-containing protein [Bdellovibrio sp.]|nr:VWA domain-containing protein [Bdellovibrio sp.]